LTIPQWLSRPLPLSLLPLYWFGSEYSLWCSAEWEMRALDPVLYAPRVALDLWDNKCLVFDFSFFHARPTNGLDFHYRHNGKQ
jgi:hypothetical protein